MIPLRGCATNCGLLPTTGSRRRDETNSPSARTGESSLFKGYTEDGKPGPGIGYPTWGTIWIDKPTHAVRKIKERFKVPRNDPMFSRSHGEREIVTEYEDVSIGEKTYTLLARRNYETKGSARQIRGDRSTPPPTGAPSGLTRTAGGSRSTPPFSTGT